MYTWKDEGAAWWGKGWLLSGFLVTFLWWILAGLQTTAWKKPLKDVLSWVWSMAETRKDTCDPAQRFRHQSMVSKPAVCSWTCCTLPEAAPALGWAQSPHSVCPHLVTQLNKFCLLEYVFPLDTLMRAIICFCGLKPFLVVYNPWVMPIPYRCTWIRWPMNLPLSLVHTLLPENCSCA